MPMRMFLDEVNVFCPKIPSEKLHYLYLSCILRLLLALTISQTWLVFDDLDGFKECYIGQVFYRVPFVWYFTDDYYPGFWGLWRKPAEVKYHFYNIRSRVHPVTCMAVHVDLDQLTDMVFVRFLDYKVALYFHTVFC